MQRLAGAGMIATRDIMNDEHIRMEVSALRSEPGEERVGAILQSLRRRARATHFKIRVRAATCLAFRCLLHDGGQAGTRR